jgi:hypothetical protein
LVSIKNWMKLRTSKLIHFFLLQCTSIRRFSKTDLCIIYILLHLINVACAHKTCIIFQRLLCRFVVYPILKYFVFVDIQIQYLFKKKKKKKKKKKRKKILQIVEPTRSFLHVDYPSFAVFLNYQNFV